MSVNVRTAVVRVHALASKQMRTTLTTDLRNGRLFPETAPSCSSTTRPHA